MYNKDLKKLNRRELLEILIEQIKENERLEKELEEARIELERRELIFQESGSLAEAALKLADIFEKADQAAEIYLSNIRK